MDWGEDSQVLEYNEPPTEVSNAFSNEGWSKKAIEFV